MVLGGKNSSEWTKPWILLDMATMQFQIWLQSNQVRVGVPGGSVVKNLPANAGHIRNPGLIPGSGRSPGGGIGNPLQYSCLENSVDIGAWRATVHTVTKSWTPLKWLSTDVCINDIEVKSRSKVSLSYFLWNPDYNLQRNMRCCRFFVLLLFWGTGVYIGICTVKIDFISITWTERLLH